MKQFDFGQNWSDFSDSAASAERASQARRHFKELLRDVPLGGRRFLDIGFGQGFSLLSALAAGARIAGCDINPKCHEVIERNRRFFPEAGEDPIPLVVGSILEDPTVAAIRACPAAEDGRFDVVHSWGVLHHTGNMALAVRNAASLVKPGGHFVIAIYNRHWSSLPWLWIKWLYVHSPRVVQKLLVGALYPVIWLAKLLVTGKNPKTKERGMDFFYDVIDWVGGYPYEYATIAEMEAMVRPLGFTLVRGVDAQVPTGCNEMVFRKGA